MRGFQESVQVWGQKQVPLRSCKEGCIRSDNKMLEAHSLFKKLKMFPRENIYFCVVALKSKVGNKSSTAFVIISFAEHIHTKEKVVISKLAGKIAHPLKCVSLHSIVEWETLLPSFSERQIPLSNSYINRCRSVTHVSETLCILRSIWRVQVAPVRTFMWVLGKYTCECPYRILLFLPFIL